MKRIPAEKKFLQNIEVIDIAEEGKGVGKSGELVIFIDKAVPGDVVDIELIRAKKNFAEAKITNLVKPSEYRAQPFCPHFGICGGCKWQHMSYDAQLKFKQKSVIDALERLGKVDTSHAEPILRSFESKYYRNKLEFTFSNKRWLTNGEGDTDNLEMNALGFHIPQRFDKILDIQTCYLQTDPSNEIRNRVRDFSISKGISYYDLRAHQGALRNLIIRTSTTGELMVLVAFAYATEEEIRLVMEFIREQFPQVTSLLYLVNQKKNDTIFDQQIHTYAGKDYILEQMPEDHPEGKYLKFKIGPKSFYQTNSEQAYELYKIAREFADLKGTELVYDLYTGTGTIATFVSRKAKRVIGIEYVPSAIEDAKINAGLNEIDNTEYFAGDMKDILTPEFVAAHGAPDVVITDPPRAGMHPDVVNRLLEMAAPKIVYVSCNAATQARDIAALKEKYEVAKIQPVDMFPHTQHVENVVLLTLRP